VLLATVLGSAMASIDATVVGIALPAIGRDFGASLTVLQWVVTAYTLTLAGLLLQPPAGDQRLRACPDSEIVAQPCTSPSRSVR
jgi:MFS family permease